MTKYMVLYRSSVSAGEQMGGSPEEAQAGMELWMQWAGKAGSAIVDMGAPLGPVATVGKAGKAAAEGVAGFSVLEAESTDAVKKLLDDHPHFHSPGDTSIEVLEFLPIPGT